MNWAISGLSLTTVSRLLIFTDNESAFNTHLCVLVFYYISRGLLNHILTTLFFSTNYCTFNHK